MDRRDRVFKNLYALDRTAWFIKNAHGVAQFGLATHFAQLRRTASDVLAFPLPWDSLFHWQGPRKAEFWCLSVRLACRPPGLAGTAGVACRPPGLAGAAGSHVARPAWPAPPGSHVARPAWPAPPGSHVARPAWPAPPDRMWPARPGRRRRIACTRPAWPARRGFSPPGSDRW